MFTCVRKRLCSRLLRIVSAALGQCDVALSLAPRPPEVPGGSSGKDSAANAPAGNGRANAYSLTGIFLAAALGLPLAVVEAAEPQVLTDRLHHLRQVGQREWSEFPEQPEADHLELQFDAHKGGGEQTLVLRMQDVKQTWLVRLNGQELGRLPTDENDMRVYFAIPAEKIAEGQNVLRIEEAGSKQPDDVRIGQIAIVPRPRSDVLAEGAVEIDVYDGDLDRLTPARITVLNRDGALQSVGAASNDHLAVRPGIVYTADGRAPFGLGGDVHRLCRPRV